MKVDDGRRLGLGDIVLEVVRLLERILTIPSVISMMSDENYNCYLALTG
jgi:hypothetical protein